MADYSFSLYLIHYTILFAATKFMTLGRFSHRLVDGRGCEPLRHSDCDPDRNAARAAGKVVEGPFRCHADVTDRRATSRLRVEAVDVQHFRIRTNRSGTGASSWKHGVIRTDAI
jgi:hypothetical protein